VLKPLDTSERALRWQEEVLAPLRGRADFRVAPPQRSRDGALVVDGWTSWPYLEGAHLPGRWVEIITVGRLFHAALRRCREPRWLRGREDRWAVADRLAWGERDVDGVDGFDALPHVHELARHRRRVLDESQLVHGDLTGNVLFHPVLPPAVIDLSPYWRPPTYAAAIVVADALVWEDAEASLLAGSRSGPHLAQYLLRALLFRIASDHGAGPAEPHPPTVGDPYRSAVDVCLRHVRR
jgi:uncharacterized protein (TIGR02569 family)